MALKAQRPPPMLPGHIRLLPALNNKEKSDYESLFPQNSREHLAARIPIIELTEGTIAHIRKRRSQTMERQSAQNQLAGNNLQASPISQPQIFRKYNLCLQSLGDRANHYTISQDHTSGEEAYKYQLPANFGRKLLLQGSSLHPARFPRAEKGQIDVVMEPYTSRGRGKRGRTILAEEEEDRCDTPRSKRAYKKSRNGR
ncbi:Transcription initiation factor TFIID subunit 12 [Fusarium oxysporum]|nr:Transcription initiation factor TFIID subunit 12 [Fusarium oxysporum]